MNCVHGGTDGSCEVLMEKKSLFLCQVMEASSSAVAEEEHRELESSHLWRRWYSDLLRSERKSELFGGPCGLATIISLCIFGF